MRGISCTRDKCINCQKGTDRTKIMIDSSNISEKDIQEFGANWCMPGSVVQINNIHKRPTHIFIDDPDTGQYGKIEM